MKYEQNHLSHQFQDNKWLHGSKIGYVSEHICHSLRRRVERLRRSVYPPPKMVQLCVQIRKPTYKILKPV